MAKPWRSTRTRHESRHARLLKNAGQAMLSDSIVAMEDLISRGEK